MAAEGGHEAHGAVFRQQLFFQDHAWRKQGSKDRYGDQRNSGTGGMRNGALTVLIWNDGLNGWIDTTSADLQGEFMNELQIFNNPKFGDVRTIKENGQVLFCGSDVAKALGYARPNDAIAQHCRSTVKRRIGRSEERR